MTLTQNDFDIIMARLDSFEARLSEMQRWGVGGYLLNAPPLKLPDAISNTHYALEQGNFMDAGVTQTWGSGNDKS